MKEETLTNIFGETIHVDVIPLSRSMLSHLTQKLFGFKILIWRVAKENVYIQKKYVG